MEIHAKIVGVNRQGINFEINGHILQFYIRSYAWNYRYFISVDGDSFFLTDPRTTQKLIEKMELSDPIFFNMLKILSIQEYRTASSNLRFLLHDLNQTSTSLILRSVFHSFVNYYSRRYRYRSPRVQEKYSKVRPLLPELEEHFQDSPEVLKWTKKLHDMELRILANAIKS